jgi:hypothetical protein
VNRLSGTFQLLSLRFTSSSSTSFPRSTSRSAPNAVTGWLMGPAWNSVAGVTRVVSPRDVVPYARAATISPLSMMARERPGIWRRAICAVMNASSESL